MLRIRTKTTGTYPVYETAVDDDGNLVTVTGTLSLKVYDGANTLLTTITPTITNSVFNASIPVATLPKLDTYSLVWSGLVGGVATEWTTSLELCGGYLFEIAELRAFDRAFTDTAKYPSELLRKVRTWVEDTIEGELAARGAFVPRGRRVKLSGSSPDLNRGYFPLMYGNDYRDLIVPNFELRSLYSASIDGLNLTQTELDGIVCVDNVLFRSAGIQFPAWPHGKNNINVHYTHGYDKPAGAITRAALILAREYLVKSDLPARASATSIGDQLFRITIAGRDGITGIPDVDAAIAQFGRASVAIG